MAYDVTLKSDPSPMPLKPAILVLIHKRRKMAFIAFTTNARGRAAVLTSMIRHRPSTLPPLTAQQGRSGGAKKGKKGAYRNHLRDLPEGDIKDFALLATSIDIDPKKADEQVAKLQRKFERDGFKLFGGARSAIPKVVLDGKRMSIVDAMEQAKCKDSYQTVYRRLERGWPIKEALGLQERAA